MYSFYREDNGLQALIKLAVEAVFARKLICCGITLVELGGISLSAHRNRQTCGRWQTLIRSASTIWLGCPPLSSFKSDSSFVGPIFIGLMFFTAFLCRFMWWHSSMDLCGVSLLAFMLSVWWWFKVFVAGFCLWGNGTVHNVWSWVLWNWLLRCHNAGSWSWTLAEWSVCIIWWLVILYGFCCDGG